MTPPRKKPTNKKTNKSDEDVQVQRNSANKRERQRTKELNDAFAILRRRIPSMPSDKMSKIHTLRIATEYIRFLDQLKTDGGKMFGIDLVDEKNCNLATTFNIWRGSLSQPAPMQCPIPQSVAYSYMNPFVKPEFMLLDDQGHPAHPQSFMGMFSFEQTH